MFKVNKLKVGSDMYTRAVVQTVSDLLQKGFITSENANDFIGEGVNQNYLNEDAKKYFENKDKKTGTDNSSTYVSQSRSKVERQERQ